MSQTLVVDNQAKQTQPWAFRPYTKEDFQECTECYSREGENMEKVQPFYLVALKGEDAQIRFFYKTGRKGTALLSEDKLFVLVKSEEPA